VNLLLPFTLFLLTVFGCNAQTVEYPAPADYVRVAFYNVENLFDTENDSMINDEEFLPDGENHWTSYRYYEKLDHISKVFLNLGGWELPAVIGLCEIENQRVLDDLVRLTGLREFEYAIVQEESPDRRGIDVALLYRPDIFRYIRHQVIRVTFPFAPEVLTRDVLHVEGTIAGDTIHVFVNHWPSRSGGQEASEPRRVYVAQQVRAAVDSLWALNPNAKVLIIGDLNDGPDDRSVAETLGAAANVASMSTPGLVDAMHALKKKGLGTHKYAGQWNTLDHIILSSGWLDTTQTLSASPEDVVIFQGEWLLEEDLQAPGNKPFRTYAGPRYLGGYSDHLPVYIDLRVRVRW
jgi:predicted extracellular nuclease